MRRLLLALALLLPGCIYQEYVDEPGPPVGAVTPLIPDPRPEMEVLTRGSGEPVVPNDLVLLEVDLPGPKGEPAPRRLKILVPRPEAARDTRPGGRGTLFQTEEVWWGDVDYGFAEAGLLDVPVGSEVEFEPTSSRLEGLDGGVAVAPRVTREVDGVPRTFVARVKARVLARCPANPQVLRKKGWESHQPGGGIVAVPRRVEETRTVWEDCLDPAQPSR